MGLEFISEFLRSIYEKGPSQINENTNSNYQET